MSQLTLDSGPGAGTAKGLHNFDAAHKTRADCDKIAQQSLQKS